MTTGNAITINTSNIVLDLNGYKIGGLGAGTATQANGIYAYQQQNITIKNGTVRGFLYGIKLDDVSPYTTSQGHVIEDIRADQNTYSGIWIAGNGNIIRNNLIIATGGASGAGADVYALALFIGGPGAQVLNNTVTGVIAQGSGIAYGIYLYTNANSVAAGNRVGNITSPSGPSYGISLYMSSDSIISDNRLTGMQYGIYFQGSGTGKYFSNVTQGVTTPYTGGTAAGTTNY
jgi:parallel beta-helix repeat protein